MEYERLKILFFRVLSFSKQVASLKTCRSIHYMFRVQPDMIYAADLSNSPSSKEKVFSNSPNKISTFDIEVTFVHGVYPYITAYVVYIKYQV